MALEISKEQVGVADGTSILFTYDNLDENDSAPAAIDMSEYADRSIQVVGSFNSGTVVLEGSNDGTNYVTLTDPQGNALSFTSAGIEQIQELTRYIRPRVSAGTGVDVDVFIMLRRASSIRN